MLTKRDAKCMPELSACTPAGQTKSLSGTFANPYTAYVYKAPPLGMKPPRSVPMLSNAFGPEAKTVCFPTPRTGSCVTVLDHIH